MKKESTLKQLVLQGLLIIITLHHAHAEKTSNPNLTIKPALNVNVIQPILQNISSKVKANGSIAAWQEAIIGSEVSDLRISEIKVEIGDIVKKNQILAVVADEAVKADIENNRALLAEAQANFADAELNADRAKQLINTGALSKQQIDQYLTTKKTAMAKMQSAKAQLDTQLLRLKYTHVLASDDGIISARNATLGAVVSKGQELFRLIRQNRLEWRAEVPASELQKIKLGSPVDVYIGGFNKIIGKVRVSAPTIDTQNRNGLVYVDLIQTDKQSLKAGMFAKGEFYVGSYSGLVVPQNAVSLKDGFSYVFFITDQKADLAKVRQVKVETGQQDGNFVEIKSSIKSEDKIVASGVTFLSDGDTVRLVQP